MLWYALPGDDPFLRVWKKQELPFLEYPPKGLSLTGWRDPFVVHSPESESGRILILGSGFQGKGGAILRYRSLEGLAKGWTFDGPLIQSMDNRYGDVWECPVLVPIHPEFEGLRNGEVGDAVSRFHGHLGTAPMRDMTSADPSTLQAGPLTHILLTGVYFADESVPGYKPVIYWLGRFKNGQFMHDGSDPRIFDLGGVMYAPNALIDQQGRTIVWLWVHEGDCPDELDYSGCLSIPRVLSIGRKGNLIQRPLPELSSLHQGPGWRAENLLVSR